MVSADNGSALTSAAERSEVYRTLAEAFSYSSATSGEFGITGADYNDAFDPSVREGACSLREGSHAEDDQSAIFEELMRFYEFFGLARGEGAEMPDHMSVELEFMHYLTHLESQVEGQPEELSSLRRAQHDFLSRHLSRLTRGVKGRMNSENPHCVDLVDTCFDFINAELALVRQRVAS